MSSVPQPLANDRFKRSSARNLWSGLLVAAALHFVLFAFGPEITAADIGPERPPIEAVSIAAEIPPPPTQEEIMRPAKPVIGADVNPEVTLPPNVSFDDYRDLPPAPPPAAEGTGRAFDFTPHDVAPMLANTAEVRRLLERAYPPTLRDAGIGGQVVLWFYIDETGIVRETRLRGSSGYEALDAAALTVADAMTFRPAQFRGRAVPVWVAIPIVFSVH